ncbi:mechanosensitive ion channel family protein [Chitinophaga rhizophila]|uniref:Mechanosensitive ion channel family protein n=1 Tax=Chitinophaga rhizophila TaxID=2866212 RepID=A0ABS7GHP1_9BACT|nr:mechanosensitive ion channel domain-containing protein [Chitinophaga rhizophila]MBW8686836.1 mechanosensitive ion channel family protein [Chitinophaga rhizophila]
MLENLQRDLHLPPIVWNILLGGAALITGLIIKYLLALVLRVTASKNETDYSLIRSTLRRLGKPINYFLPVLVLDMVLPFMELARKPMNVLNRVVEISLIIAFGFMLTGLVKVFEDYIMHAYDLKKEDNLRERKMRTQLQFVRKLAITTIMLLTLCAVLLSFDSLRKIGAGLLTGVGVGGIIIGFAAQRSLANFLAGMQLAFTQPIRIDDVLVVEGEWGRVEEITLTYVVLGIWDQRKLILPINYFIEKPFQNWTRTGSAILGTAFLYLDYTAPIDILRAEFERLVKDHPLWDKRVQVMQVTNITDRSVEIRMLVSCNSSGKAFDLRCFLRENMLSFIQQNHAYCLPKTRAVFEDKDTPLLQG